MKNNSKIKAVILDFDDTIFATFNCSFERHSFIAKKLNLNVPKRNEFFKEWGLPWKIQIKTLWPEIDFEFYQSHYWKHFGDSVLPLLEGAKESIEFLSKKYFLAIVTSRDRDSIFRRLKQAEINPEIFKSIVSVDDSKVHKPNPKVFAKVFEKLDRKKISRNETIYVGDLLTDYCAAKNAGIHFAAVLTGLHKSKDFEKAGLDKKFILNSLKDLPEFLAKARF